jgi:hypothetical protein
MADVHDTAQLPPTEGAAEEAGKAAAPPQAPLDFSKLHVTALRVLRDPAGGLEASYTGGQQAMVTGLIVGGGALVLVPLVNALFLKLGPISTFPDFGYLMRQLAGAVVFLAAGTAVGHVMRRSLGRSTFGDWRDDVYIFGCPMVFLLAGTVASGLLALIRDSFFQQLAGAAGAAALLLAVMSYFFGLTTVARVEPRRTVWIVPAAFALALLTGGLLNFSP